MRISPVVEQRNMLNALNSASWRTGLEGVIFVIQMLLCVLFQWDARVPPLLRTIMDQAIFADVKVAAAGPAAPVARNPARNVFLVAVET